ncbi:MAG TPA: divalent-cation tolerance protein CutA [bacterium]|nr:divalent-cation tolerance protein CutA [bacterium]
MILVYITNPSCEQARTLAKHLIEKRLIACANIYSGVTSLYRWKGTLAEESECVMIGKTQEALFDSVRREVERVHPYEIPCILKIPVSANEAFLNWLEGEVSQETGL